MLADIPANLSISPLKRTWLLCHVWYFHLIYRFIISFGPLSFYSLPFQVVEVAYFPSHGIAPSVWEALKSLLTTNLIRQARLTTLCQKIRTFSKDDRIKASQETPASLNKNNRGKCNTETYVTTINLIAHCQTMPQWWLVRLSRK